MRRVIVESPYAGPTEAAVAGNVEYAQDNLSCKRPAISDDTWAALEAWLRKRNPYDTASPYNWVAVPVGVANWKHIPYSQWERNRRNSALPPRRDHSEVALEEDADPHLLPTPE